VRQNDPQRSHGIRILGYLALILSTLAFGIVASRSTAPTTPLTQTNDVRAVAGTIDVLIHPSSNRDPIAELPADYVTFSHVAPERVIMPGGTIRAVIPDGGCSTFWGGAGACGFCGSFAMQR